MPGSATRYIERIDRPFLQGVAPVALAQCRALCLRIASDELQKYVVARTAQDWPARAQWIQLVQTRKCLRMFGDPLLNVGRWNKQSHRAARSQLEPGRKSPP